METRIKERIGKHFFIRLVALCLVCLMLGMAAACGNAGTEAGRETGKEPVDTKAETEFVTETEAAGESETLPERYRADVPDSDFENWEFRVLVSDPGTVVWYDTDFSVTDFTGDIVEDAVYNRNKNVEEDLHIRLTPVWANPLMSQLDKSVTAGTDDFDICFAPPQPVNAYIQRGYFVNLYDVPHLNLAAPWWDQNAVQGLKFDDQLYLACGGIGYNYLRSTSVLFFSKPVAKEFQLDDPYAMVENGTWTLEAFFDLAEQATVDLGGGGTDPSQDQMGLVYCGDSAYQWMIGAGVNFIVTDSNHRNPEMVIVNSDTIEVFDMLTSFLYSQSANWDKTHVNAAVQFLGGKLLFLPTEFWVISQLREGQDFGVLPLPKYDEYQENYRHTVNQTVASMMLIPQTNRRLSDTGIVVETLAAEGQNDIISAYIERSLITRDARDAESEKPIRTIFSTIHYDLGFMYDIGGIKSTLTVLVNGTNTNFVSTIERQTNIINDEIAKMVENYATMKKNHGA